MRKQRTTEENREKEWEKTQRNRRQKRKAHGSEAYPGIQKKNLRPEKDRRQVLLIKGSGGDTAKHLWDCLFRKGLCRHHCFQPVEDSIQCQLGISALAVIGGGFCLCEESDCDGLCVF